LTPRSGGTPSDIGVIYILLKSTFKKFVVDNTGLSPFFWSLLGSTSAKSREITREFDLIAVQGHPRSSIFVSIESTYTTCY